ncbi:hypothetical protein CQ018_08785 [Arthrobacter sp. MYb227]|uniref:hypothetical protein n=1 Tax=Arthrobacter sp. MYb227 TaxID=1848601 RepID=UPI000CFB0FCA|nr:hypothetical protein [Arthrobacter sp. MYb227]PQZ93740.1 hypothetical protein CQ018_08785 [Arthrobacter sp. MYb227]
MATLSEELAIPNYYDLSSTFASMGSHDGLLIIVQQDRFWFPTKVSKSARGPLTVRVEPLAGKFPVNLSSNISIVS